MSQRVLLFGTFDDLHPGHRFVLDEARARGDVSVVVARDGTVLKIKGRAPLQSQDDRVQPDLILLGYDQQLPPGVTEADLLCPVERLEAFEPHVHKSSLRRKI